jgi:hypothetical protein
MEYFRQQNSGTKVAPYCLPGREQQRRIAA